MYRGLTSLLPCLLLAGICLSAGAQHGVTHNTHPGARKKTVHKAQSDAQNKVQTAIDGIIQNTGTDTLQLVSGASYRRASNVNVTLLGDQKGDWVDLQPGDKVRFTLNAKDQVLSLQVLARIILQRQETPLSRFVPVEGGWQTATNVIVHGRVFDHACVMNRRSHAIFVNNGDYDLLEAWIGKRAASDTDEARFYGITFFVYGDGQELYRSVKMVPTDPAVKISVPIKGYHTITLVAQSAPTVFLDYTAVWGDPVLVKLPTRLPTLLAPPMNAALLQNTTLSWSAVRDAAGYLLELQCLQLADPADADNPNRFLVVKLPAQTTTYDFDISKMPKGRWQWRVHALSETGFLGRMNDWSSFQIK